MPARHVIALNRAHDKIASERSGSIGDSIQRISQATMPHVSPAARPLRVLLSEGGSTSARQAVTVLGLAGHHVELCDPSPLCLARLSRFVRAFHRCPPLSKQPAAYLDFVEAVVKRRGIDVLLPIHEQGLLFSQARARLAPQVAIALPDYASYRTALAKASFSRLLDELGLPQPRTRIVGTEAGLRDAIVFPCVIKTSVGTASRGVWRIDGAADLDLAVQDLRAACTFDDEVLVQDLVDGAIEHAQALFSHGELIALHGYRQIASGAGGGDAIKQSLYRDDVRADIAVIGARLSWHGALSFDYIQPGGGARPLYIDCNPRLVEPMSAQVAGVEMIDMLLRLSLGERVQSAPRPREGVRTHLAMQALLGAALRGGSRREVWRECLRLMRRLPPYDGSVEELTPVRQDWLSAVPLTATALILLAAPRRAAVLAAKGWGEHLLDADTLRIIDRNFA
jgi:predicted ATP-grasp superfamily ATP-dependent carboligase